MKTIWKQKGLNTRSYKLDGQLVNFNALMEVKTGDKKQTENEIRSYIVEGLQQQKEVLKGKLLDVVVVAYVPKHRYFSSRNCARDVDNILKVVIDSLVKPRNDPSDTRYLLEDDSCIVRVLGYKLPKEDDQNYDTNELQIVIREHNPEKQMVLGESGNDVI